jgi:arylsulfatase A-like enzyme
LTYFPEYLQQAGYQTAFFGKWHMGDESDDPQPGFNHWESFKGQGVYTGVTLNINGEHTSYEDTVYTSDLLTEHAVEWMEQIESDQPFSCIYHTRQSTQNSSRQPAMRGCMLG